MGRAAAVLGTLVFVLGWSGIIWLAANPSGYASAVERPALETLLGYGPMVTLVATALWFLAIYALRAEPTSPGSGDRSEA